MGWGGDQLTSSKQGMLVNLVSTPCFVAEIIIFYRTWGCSLVHLNTLLYVLIFDHLPTAPWAWGGVDHLPHGCSEIWEICGLNSQKTISWLADWLASQQLGGRGKASTGPTCGEKKLYKPFHQVSKYWHSHQADGSHQADEQNVQNERT